NPITYTAQVINGVATFDPADFYGQPLSTTTTTPHSISATFNGDNTFDPSSTSLNQTVNQASTTLGISSAPSNPVPGQPVTVTAIFTAVAPGAGVPTGIATFTVDGVNPSTPLGNGQVQLNPAGQAIIVLTDLSASVHRIRVAYNGDTNFLGVSSTSDTLVTV